MTKNAGTGWLPGALVGCVGVLAIGAGLMSGGPDTVGGLVFGVVALAAAAVMIRRRESRPDGE